MGTVFCGVVMSFNSFVFLFLFLPVTLIGYHIINKYKSKYSKWFLVLASLVFYGYCFPKGLLVLLFSLFVNYFLAVKILKTDNKNIAVAGIIFNIILLAFFKYGGLVVPSLDRIISAPGISFYSFLEIALLCECYKKTINKINVDEYAFLITFFPKLMQGPIADPGTFLSEKNAKKTGIEEVYRFIMLFSMGCFKKVIIADTLGSAVDYGFSSLNAMHTGEALIIMLSYTLQLYFDFSGYCDMGMAIAGLFGYELPLNFNSPYKARNIYEFWKGWHITLTGFFTKYLYIPLGGNRKGRARTYINFLIIFFVSGLWHGAGFQFIIWGLMHGLLYVVCRMISDRSGKKHLSENKVYSAFSTLLTFIYVNVAWVFFRAPSVKEALHLFSDMGQLWFPRFNAGLAKCFNIEELWYVIKILHLDRGYNSLYYLMCIILVLLLIIVFAFPTAYEYSRKCKINLRNTLLMTVLFVWSVLSFEGVATYLYINF